MIKLVLLVVTTGLLSACGGGNPAQTIKASAVRAAFASQGIPIVDGPGTTLGGFRAAVLEFDPAKLVNKNSIKSEFLTIFVLRDTASRTRAMKQPAVRTFIRANGLRVMTRENVVVALVKRDVTARFVSRVRAALLSVK